MKTAFKGIAVLVTWVAWKHTASLSMCWLFWLTVLAVEIRIRQVNYGVCFPDSWDRFKCLGYIAE